MSGFWGNRGQGSGFSGQGCRVQWSGVQGSVVRSSGVWVACIGFRVYLELRQHTLALQGTG